MLRKFALLVVVLNLLSCSSNSNRIESDLGIADAPDWVNEGSRAISNADGRLIHGVGSAGPLGDFSLQKLASENRARAEIARILATYMHVFQSDYAAANSDSEEISTALEWDIESTSAVLLQGSRIIAHWHDEDSEILYSAAEIDMEKMADIAAATQSNTPTMQQYFERHWADSFDRLGEHTDRDSR